MRYLLLFSLIIVGCFRPQGPALDQIIDEALSDGEAYDKLERLCDDVGHRISGSDNYRKAVEWAKNEMRKEGLVNIHSEMVEVPHWIRGDESVTMLEPHRLPMRMIGLGMSVGTPSQGITGEIVAVESGKELEALGREKVEGKIVLFNNRMPKYDPIKEATFYGHTVVYRLYGAAIAQKLGAQAVVIRSVTAFSLDTPHTGVMYYTDPDSKEDLPDEKKIPAAALTTEAADILHRLYKRGKKVVINLKMNAIDKGLSMDANVVGEIRGSEKPEEIIIVGGHLDSWDTGQGAHDDGSGCVMALETVGLMNRLGLKPKRTIRVVLFAAEEFGIWGGKQYYKQHKKEMKNIVAGIEADCGCFEPRGYNLDHMDKAKRKQLVKVLQKHMKKLEPKLGKLWIREGGSGPDIAPMKPGGPLLLGMRVDNSRYFDVHHTPADTFDKINPEHLAKCTAMMASTAWILANEDKKPNEP